MMYYCSKQFDSKLILRCTMTCKKNNSPRLLSEEFYADACSGGLVKVTLSTFFSSQISIEYSAGEMAAIYEISCLLSPYD